MRQSSIQNFQDADSCIHDTGLMQEAGSRSMRAVKVIECNVRASRTVLLLKLLPMLNFRMDLHTRGTVRVEDLQHQFHRAGHTCHAWPGERCNLPACAIYQLRGRGLPMWVPCRAWSSNESQDIKPMKVHVNDFDFVACKAYPWPDHRVQFRQPALQYHVQGPYVFLPATEWLRPSRRS